MSENPVVVEVTRGGRVESAHRGAGIVVDADGAVLFTFGDVNRLVFPRSAAKPMQALPLIESGAAEKFALGEAELELACGSHSGEPVHVKIAQAMLAKAGLTEAALGCGVQWPLGAEAERALARTGAEPSQLHNNCSGKHAGFLCAACAQGIATESYVEADHPLQREVTAAIEGVCLERLDDSRRGTDGCAIPAYALPLAALALGYARLATGRGLAPVRAAAGKRLLAAMAARPDLVAGTGRFDTRAMQALNGRAVTKTGAEGVFAAALPELELGLAVKADDGATRAAETMIAALIARLLPIDDPAAFAPLRHPVLTNWRGDRVGEMRPAGRLAAQAS